MSTAIHLFIDTNIFLGFFSYNNDDIEQLKKLSSLIVHGEVVLYLTDQVCQEFSRNRERKIVETIDNFSMPMNRSIPRLFHHYPKSDEYQELEEKAKQLRKELVEDVKRDAGSQTLPPDTLFTELTEAASPILSDEEIILAAIRRRDLGHPPGKNQSLGDQINWELLIRKVPPHSDLHLISKDGDFKSPLDRMMPHPFLQKEWTNNKESKLFVYEEIRMFLKRYFPNINVPTDVAKERYIKGLVESRSFEETHRAIRNITNSGLDMLNRMDLERLIQALSENNQISYILSDSDVEHFYKDIALKASEQYSFSKEALESLTSSLNYRDVGKYVY